MKILRVIKRGNDVITITEEIEENKSNKAEVIFQLVVWSVPVLLLIGSYITQ